MALITSKRFDDLHRQLDFIHDSLHHPNGNTDLHQIAIALKGLREEYHRTIRLLLHDVLLCIFTETPQLNVAEELDASDQSGSAWVSRLMSARRVTLSTLGFQSRHSSEETSDCIGPWNPPDPYADPLGRAFSQMMEPQSIMGISVECSEAELHRPPGPPAYPGPAIRTSGSWSNATCQPPRYLWNMYEPLSDHAPQENSEIRVGDHIPTRPPHYPWNTYESVMDQETENLVERLLPTRPHLRGGCRSYVEFISSRGNEYFCEIDEDYLTDRFNLTGLNTEVQYYQYALDLVTDVFDLDCDDEMREQIEKSARHLYGLVHARYIVTTRGLQKMMEKYKKGDFGKCPRVACDGQPLLPMGQNDNANTSAVKLYCGRCEDIYNPKSSRHAAIDGAYFGTSFHNIMYQVYPNSLPSKSPRRYEPRIYGFRVHAAAALARWQHEHREATKTRLKALGLDTGFEAEEREEELLVEESDDEVDQGQDGIDDMFEGQGMAQVAH